MNPWILPRNSATPLADASIAAAEEYDGKPMPQPDHVTDNDPEFADRIYLIAHRMAQGIPPRSDSDPLDVAAAQLWLDWTFPKE